MASMKNSYVRDVTVATHFPTDFPTYATRLFSALRCSVFCCFFAHVSIRSIYIENGIRHVFEARWNKNDVNFVYRFQHTETQIVPSSPLPQHRLARASIKHAIPQHKNIEHLFRTVITPEKGLKTTRLRSQTQFFNRIDAISDYFLEKNTWKWPIKLSNH